MVTETTTLVSPGQATLSALESNQKARDVILLYYKQSFQIQNISYVLGIPVDEVEQIISNFALNFSTEEFLMNVVNRIASMKRRDRQGADTPEMSDKDKEIARLKKQLKDAEIKAEFYEEMIRIAENQFNIPIRKKAGTKQ